MNTLGLFEFFLGAFVATKLVLFYLLWVSVNQLFDSIQRQAEIKLEFATKMREYAEAWQKETHKIQIDSKS